MTENIGFHSNIYCSMMHAGRYAILVVLLLFVSVTNGYPTPGNDSLLLELSQVLKKKDVYLKEKNDRIERLKRIVESGEILSTEEQFNAYAKLHQEYQSFQYDSAFAYALKLQRTARQLHDVPKITYAKLKLSFTLLSAGMFKETFDSLHTVQLHSMPDSIKAEYYILKSRAYYDIAAYSADAYYTQYYIKRGNAVSDSALALVDKGTLEYYYLRGIKNINQDNLEEAKRDFQLILRKYDPTLHEFATTASSLAHVYRISGETEKAISLMIQAAIADVKSSTTEAVAMISLAELLFNQGDENKAYAFIRQAFEDANFYGAKQRKIHVSSILPIIEGEKLAAVEEQKSRLVVYASVVTLLSVLALVFFIIILGQFRQLQKAKRIVSEANANLHDINKSLVEANRIKEEYIGHSFNLYSGYIDKIEHLKRAIDKRLMARKYDEIGYVIKGVNLKKEREALNQSFDQVFLRLFPDFVSSFNSFFREEDKYVLKKPDSLNTELRIFALIRIGISDHEQIAKILEYSVSTVYNYKTKVKNRSRLPNEEFENKLMDIEAF